MNVEGGTISAGVTLVGGGGPSVGGGIGVSAGPVVGVPGREFGPSVGIGSTIIENTMPLTLNKFNVIGEIKFNAAPQLNEADAVAEAESIISQTSTNPLTEGGAVLEAEHWLEFNNTNPSVIPAKAGIYTNNLWIPDQIGDDRKVEAYIPRAAGIPMPDVIQAQRTKTALEAAGMVDLSTQVVNYLKPELKQAYQQTITIPTPIPQSKLVEQIVEKREVVVDDKVDKNIDTLEEEEVEELRLKNVVDIPVSEQRVYEIEQATDKAESEAKAEGVEGIEGWRIVKFLPHQHPGNESGIIRNTGLRDGSLDETEQELATKQFASKAEVKQRAAVLVSKEKPPVKQDKDGQLVEDQDVARVFKHNIFKSHPAKEVVLRIFKKRKVEVVKEAGQPAQVVSDVKSEVTEGRIEDYPVLAEVFPKAA